MEGNAQKQRSEEPPTRLSGHVLVVATDELVGEELIGELRGRLRTRGAEKVMVVAPAVEKTPFRHALGDVDTAVREAKSRLETSLAELRRNGVPALGEVGDSDPLVAAEDALRQFGADEVLVIAHDDDQALWFEDELFERFRSELHPPVSMLTVRREAGERGLHLTGVEQSGPGLDRPRESDVKLSSNLPRFTRGDLLGILVAIIGTIAAIVLAATGPSSETAAGAAQILIAMAVALINMAHVVGILLLESVRYRGGWQRFFRNLSATATPAAVIANALITALS